MPILTKAFERCGWWEKFGEATVPCRQYGIYNFQAYKDFWVLPHLFSFPLSQVCRSDPFGFSVQARLNQLTSVQLYKTFVFLYKSAYTYLHPYFQNPLHFPHAGHWQKKWSLMLRLSLTSLTSLRKTNPKGPKGQKLRLPNLTSPVLRRRIRAMGLRNPKKLGTLLRILWLLLKLKPRLLLNKEGSRSGPRSTPEHPWCPRWILLYSYLELVSTKNLDWEHVAVFFFWLFSSHVPSFSPLVFMGIKGAAMNMWRITCDWNYI